MIEGGVDTTEREESVHGAPVRRLALDWAWPDSRIERLQGSRLLLGRDEAAHVPLDGAGVSRAHAELYRQGPIYVIRDLGSTNGTWLDGRRVEHAAVAPGKVLRIGPWVGVFTERVEEDPEFGELAPGLFGGALLSRTLEPLRRAATSSLSILLVGDTGTGKERFARASHQLSGRSGPFLAVNCAALPDQLAEAELFGYRRGAFTGAERASSGYFRAAHTGTLFLDEMPELPLSTQAKLLRILEDGQVRSLGETEAVGVDVRIVSASQRPLSVLVAEGRLREDLAARLSGVEVRIPSLAARRSDVGHLFRQLLNQHTGGRPPAVEPRLVEALCLHGWPQNVRELELVTRRLVAMQGDEAVLRRQHLPSALCDLVEDLSPSSAASARPLRDRHEHDLERLQQALESSGGNLKAAAASLGISRQRAYRLLERRPSSTPESANEPDDAGR